MKNRQYFPVLMVLSVLCSIAFLYGCGTNPTSGGGGSSGTAWIYCGNYVDKTISIIDGTTNTVTGSIELPSDPTWLAAAPDGKHIYCLSSATNDVYAINTATDTVETTYSVSGSTTSSDRSAVSADNQFLYITRWNSLTLYKLNLVTGTEESLSLGQNPYCIALSADRKTAYIPIFGDMVKVVSLETLGAHSISAQTGENSAYQINAAVKNNKLYMTLQGSKECLEIDLASEAVTNVMTSDASLLMGIVSIPGTNKLYVTNASGTGQIRIIDSSVPTFESTPITGDTTFVAPAYMAVTDDSSKAYVYDFVKSAGQIAVASTAGSTIETYIPVGRGDYQKNNPVIIYK